MAKCNNQADLADTIRNLVDNISGKKAFEGDIKQNTIAVLDLEHNDVFQTLRNALQEIYRIDKVKQEIKVMLI